MLYFKAKMHQIWFQLRLHLTPLGELTALTKPPSWIQGVLLLKEERREKKKRKRGGKERGKGS